MGFVLVSLLFGVVMIIGTYFLKSVTKNLNCLLDLLSFLTYIAVLLNLQ